MLSNALCFFKPRGAFLASRVDSCVRLHSASFMAFSRRNIVQSKQAQNTTQIAAESNSTKSALVSTSVMTSSSASQLQQRQFINSAPLLSAGASNSSIWNHPETWCSLCVEPHNDWNTHVGKREHICLALVHDAIVHSDRRWNPETVWLELESWLRHSSSNDSDADGASSKEGATETGVDRSSILWDKVNEEQDEKVKAMLGVPPEVFMANTRSPLIPMYMAYDMGAGPLMRRQELYACLRHMGQCGLLPPADNRGAWVTSSFEGQLVTFKELFPLLAQMFPHAEAKDISALTQMVAAPFAYETMFDLCGFWRLAPAWCTCSAVSPLSTQPLVTTAQFEDSSGGTRGRRQQQQSQQQQQCEEDEMDLEDDDGAGQRAARQKSTFCRGALGALRWATEPQSVAMPSTLSTSAAVSKASSSTGKRFAQEKGLPHHECPRLDTGEYLSGYQSVLAAHTVRLMLSELVFYKISEYVTRLEGVFRDVNAPGLGEAALYRHCNNTYYNSSAGEQAAAAAASASPDATELVQQGGNRASAVSRAAGRYYFMGQSGISPVQSNWGMLQYMDNGNFVTHRYMHAEMAMNNRLYRRMRSRRT